MTSFGQTTIDRRGLLAEVVEQAKQHILDTFAAMIPGSGLPPAQAALKFARRYATDATATIAASRLTASPLEAALVNGMLAHPGETDDPNEFSQSHPGCAVIPAALTAREKFGVDGAHFLRAVTLGYDVGPRHHQLRRRRVPRREPQGDPRDRRECSARRAATCGASWSAWLTRRRAR